MESAERRIAQSHLQRASRRLSTAEGLLSEACHDLHQIENGMGKAALALRIYRAVGDLVDVLKSWSPTGLSHEPTAAELEELARDVDDEAARWVPHAQGAPGGAPGADR